MLKKPFSLMGLYLQTSKMNVLRSVKNQTTQSGFTLGKINF